VTIALRPGCNETIVKTVAWYPITFRKAKDSGDRYDWSIAYCWVIWLTIAFVLAGLILPGAFATLSMSALFGYLWIALVPLVAVTYNKNTSRSYQITRAYAIMTKLKQGWADHGEVFYRQIWNHNCNNEHPDYSSCRYCSDRYDELNNLLTSQRLVEENYSEPINNELFEASAQFRAAVAKQFDPDPIMKEISDKAEQNALPGNLKERLKRGLK
jgi:hypothetical protein